MRSSTRKPQVLLIVLAFLCLFVYGFVDNLKGATLPFILDQFELNYSQGGLIQQGAYFGFLASTLITGYLLQKKSHRFILYLACAFLFLGIVFYSTTNKANFLLFSMIAIGLGIGFLDLIGIRLIVDSDYPNTGQLLNLSAFFHGFASMIAPIYVGFLINSKGMTWNFAYLYSLFLVLILLGLTSLLEKIKVNTEGNSQSSFLAQIYSSLQNKRAWTYYILIMSYETIEIGYAVWASEFIHSVSGQSASTSFAYLSYFFFFLMIGRLLGSFMVERIGYKKFILYTSLAAAVLLGLGVFASDDYLFCLPLSGLFLAPIFPTATAAASEDLQKSESMELSLFFTFAGLGGMIGSWLIGFIADLFGLRIGFSLLMLMALNISVMSLIILNRRNKTKG